MKQDPYLTHAFGAVYDEMAKRGQRQQRVFLPMLVRTVTSDWQAQIRELEISSRLGTIWACIGSQESISVMESDPAVLGIEASRPASDFDVRQSIGHVRADRIQNTTLSGASRPEKGNGAIVAIIDTGIDVLHQAFHDPSGQTRIIAIWDQTDTSGSPPPTTKHLRSPYGTLHTEHAINRYIQRGSPPSTLGRDASGGHGTHVASIAAGSRIAGSTFPGGIAPEAKLLIVKPKLQVGPTDPLSLGYSTSHLDALAFIKDFAASYRENNEEPSGFPVVVNLSQGMNAGAHDGTSLLEAAFDEFSGGGREPGYIVVKSAGNERGERGHAKLFLQRNTRRYLKWENTIDHSSPDIVEIWFKGCDEVLFRLEDPNGDISSMVDQRDDRKTGTYNTSGNKYELTYVKYHHDNGDSRLLISIGPGSASFIKTGTWTLIIDTKDVKDGEMHAWIERTSSRPLNFVTDLSDEVTLSVPGTARTVIAVGSIENKLPFCLSSYSSYGPTREGRTKPDVVAPGEDIEAAQSTTTTGLTIKSGTSMAAPHVTGAIALLLSLCKKRGRQVNSAQVSAALDQLTQNYNGRHTPGMGFGVLDVEAFLKAFE